MTFRFPGILNQAETWLEVQDGTSPRAAAARPGPVNTGGPAPTRYDRPELLTPADTDELIAEQQALWLKIKKGLERETALAEAWKASETKFAYLDDSLGFQEFRGRRMETAGESGPEIYSSLMWKLSADRRKEAFQSALRRTPEVMENYQKVNALFYLYDELCKSEFASLEKSLKPSFNNPVQRKGIKEPWEYYRWVRQFYFRAGYDNPAAYLNKEIKPVWFLGRPVGGGVNTKMRVILDLAQKETERMGFDAQFEVQKGIQNNPGGFVPRPIANSNQLSNHSLGQALDFDPSTNPHLVGNPATAIDKVLAWLQSKGKAGPERVKMSLLTICAETEAEAEQNYRKMKAISDALQRFLQEWLQAWEEATTRREAARAQIKKLDQQTQTLEKKSQALEQKKSTKLAPGEVSLVSVAASSAKADLDRTKSDLDREKAELANVERVFSSLSGFEAFANVEELVMAWSANPFVSMTDGIKQARHYRDKGMLTLPMKLFVAFKKAGARSGVEYGESKDSMHFEVPPGG